ncbi:MAG TPA: hypothetical protein VEX38_01730, partial [Fimbriimonadaceae bacterium]|nr:hypothetical protein [Fimbriimonadaceae bacterium]
MRQLMKLCGIGAAILTCFTAASASEISLTLKRPLKAKELKQLAQHLGEPTVVSSNGLKVRVKLYDSVSRGHAIENLHKHPVVAEVSAAEGGDDLNTISGVRKHLAERRLEQEKLLGRPLKPTAKLPGTNYLEARLWYLQQRAYPNDYIDWSIYPKAAAQRDKMQPAPLASPEGQFRAPSTMWQYVGPRNLDVPYRPFYGVRPLSGRVSAIAYDSASPSTTFYIGSGFGGLFKTANNGTSFTHLSQSWPFLHVSSIAVHPTNSSVVLVGTGDFSGNASYGNGIMVSTNGGSTWTQRGASGMMGFAIRRILFDPDDPNTVLAITGRGPNGAGQVWRSTNQGVTWTVSLNISANWSGATIGLPNSSGVRPYYVTGGANPGQIWRSTDRGATWTALTAPISTGGHGVLDIAASRAFVDRVYLLCPKDRKIFRSSNQGASWADVTNNFPDGSSNYNWSQGTYDFHITCSSRVDSAGTTRDVVYVGLIDLAVSRDSGSTWSSIGGPTYDAFFSRIHNDQQSMAVRPDRRNEALVGNDGGLYRLTFNPDNGDATYTNLNGALSITQFYAGAWHPTSTSRMIGGAQDQATPVATGDLQNWGNVVGGDGGGCGISQDNGDIQFGTSQRYGLNDNDEGRIHHTNVSWFFSGEKPVSMAGERVPFIGSMALDNRNPPRVYIGTNFLHRWEDSIFGGGWTRRLGNQLMDSNDGVVSAIAVAPSNNSRIYVGTS